MSLEDEIARAVRHHERWKYELRAAIDNDKRLTDAAEIEKDNICLFGRWLDGPTIPSDARFDPHYIIVKFLHEKFHEVAGRVVTLVSDGRKAEAIALLSDDGQYTRESKTLVAAMMQWQESVQKGREEKRLHHEDIYWNPISTVPLNRNVQVAVIDQQGIHQLVFPCVRIADGWLTAKTKQRIDLKPTHWREWVGTRQVASG